MLDLWAGWLGCFNRHRHRHVAIWRVVPHCVMWCIWRERNARHFEDCELTIPELKLLFFQTLYEWVVSLGCFSLDFLVELIDICTFLIFLAIP